MRSDLSESKQTPILCVRNGHHPEPEILLEMGTSSNPEGQQITVNRNSLLKNGAPWLPVMGEFHYSRYPHPEWAHALRKIKAGGIDILATYIFWIHHEENEGRFDWTGRRSLRQFVQTCQEIGLFVVVRCGPWCHGEVRNGGLPDWLLTKGLPLRSNDPTYLGYVRRLYTEIADQLQGLLWKEGGPVIGLQVENEYAGPAEHLLTLKDIACEAGLDVPLYTRTGWPELSTPLPSGALLPLFGGYPDGFWDRSLRPMLPAYSNAFLFTHIRADAAIATDQLGQRAVKNDLEHHLYPYFACEIGGGMERSYHRRIRIAPQDIAALALVKIGSGNNLQGYYMYHGGTNPQGQISSLQESQATGYWNDLPVKSYDFQAPLGEFGQVRAHYHWLRRLHLFLRDFGPRLALMPMHLPEQRVETAEDIQTLRWCIRADGNSGFLFINNYQRLQSMPSKPEIQFRLRLPASTLKMPSKPLTVPADSAFFWPFQLDLGEARLRWATAQLLCQLHTEETDYWVFAETPGISTEFVFDKIGMTLLSTAGQATDTEECLEIKNIPASRDAAVLLQTAAGRRLGFILLSEADSLTCWKENFLGCKRLFLTPASFTQTGNSVSLSAAHAEDLSLAILPAPPRLLQNDQAAIPTADGLFQRFSALPTLPAKASVHWELVRDAGEARQVAMGSQGVAEAPTESDFEQAAVWRLRMSSGTSPERDIRLHIRYVGDVARLYLAGELLTDNFYNGSAFEIGLKRCGAAAYTEEMLLKILPLRQDAPIYLPEEARPDFGDAESRVTLIEIDVLEEHMARFTG